MLLVNYDFLKTKRKLTKALRAKRG